MKKCFMKLFVFFFLISAMFCIIPGIISYADEAVDGNPSNWAINEIKKASTYNLLIDGIDQDYKASITREEFCEIAVKLYEVLSGNAAESGEGNPYTDTQNPEVIKANRLGIAAGVGDGKFSPYDIATREEVSVMLYRTLQAAKPDYDLTNKNNYIFSDQDLISSWAEVPVAFLQGTGVICGVGNNMINPLGTASREEATSMAVRVYENFNNADKILDDPHVILINQLKDLIPLEMGKPYQWGATGPNSYDCSGLVYSLFGKLGISLPRVAADQAKVGTYIPKSDLEYGDLVFFARDGANVNHVGIYVGNGEFVNAPSTGDAVKKTTLMSGYYNNTYYTARRVIP